MAAEALSMAAGVPVAVAIHRLLYPVEVAVLHLQAYPGVAVLLPAHVAVAAV